jgi:hypothetical protein
MLKKNAYQIKYNICKITKHAYKTITSIKHQAHTQQDKDKAQTAVDLAAPHHACTGRRRQVQAKDGPGIMPARAVL